MDQQELRILEKQCIQEQPPWCTAACPLHVDARSFVRAIAEDNQAEAWKVLSRTMPMPEILGRICDAPCREQCKRSEAGDAIEIGALERFFVSRPLPRRRVMPLPGKSATAAVIGDDLAGLTAAWDLAQKGYKVTVFFPEDAPGSGIIAGYPDVLSREILDRELELFTKLGVKFQETAEINRPDFIEQILNDFDAVLISTESADSSSWNLKTGNDGKPVIDPKLRQTSRPNIFWGGTEESPIRNAAQGRWAATSIDRFLQKVSQTAGREKDGPYETKLFTSLAGIDPVPAVRPADPGGLYTSEEAGEEAARCIQCECMECVKVCPYLESYKGYPKKYAREIYNNESIVMGTRQANKMINSCSLCGLCETVCPNDFAMQDLCLEARRSMVRRGKMPPSAHEFALLDMEFSQSERFYLAKPEPGMDRAAFLFFPGCQLAATRPDQAVLVYDHLRNSLDGGVGLFLGCCGAPAYWAARTDAFEEAIERFRQNWNDLGGPQVITACSTCLSVFRDNLPEVDAVSIWQVFDKTAAPPGEIRQPASPVAVHDPCTTRGMDDVQAAVRSLLDKTNTPYEELDLSKSLTECCGFGGLMQSANPELARDVATRRAGRSEADYLAYCAMCRDSLAGTGKRVLHLLDIFFPGRDEDPALAPRVGWSDRQENRAMLKARLQREIWNEDEPGMEEHQEIKLVMDSDIREKLDKRRILDEDVQRVIHHAETTGDRLKHPETGRYKAVFKPYKATFWVEYAPEDGAFRIFNAYAHRMEVVGGGRL